MYKYEEMDFNEILADPEIDPENAEVMYAIAQCYRQGKGVEADAQKYVEQVTTYPTTVKHKSYFTDEQGYLILPQNLKIGHYRIEEVNAPYGFVRTRMG